MNRLRELFDQHGQSPWLDNLRRGWITSGELQVLIDRGVRGITSNPSIFQKAMSGTDDYDEQLSALAEAGRSIEDSYWELVTRDIVDALDLLRPVHEATGGLDGFVSVEVDPSLAADTGGTEAAARHLSSLTRPAGTRQGSVQGRVEPGVARGALLGDAQRWQADDRGPRRVRPQVADRGDCRYPHTNPPPIAGCPGGLGAEGPGAGAR